MSDIFDSGDVTEFDPPARNELAVNRIIDLFGEMFVNTDAGTIASYLKYDYDSSQLVTFRQILLPPASSRERLLDDIIQSPKLVEFLDTLIDALVDALDVVDAENEEDADINQEGDEV